MRKVLFIVLLLSARPVLAQSRTFGTPEGLWQGYDGEWRHVSSQLLALAEATPEEKFSWRPAPGVRSTSEVYMHIALANFYLLSMTGPKMPVELKPEMAKTVTSKAEVINWLKRSLDAVKQARLAVTPKDLERKVHIPMETIGTPPWKACICASSSTPTSTWGSSSPTPACPASLLPGPNRRGGFSNPPSFLLRSAAGTCPDPQTSGFGRRSPSLLPIASA